MLKQKRTYLMVVLLCIFVFSGSAYAVKFTGDACFGKHNSNGDLSNEDLPTEAWFLVKEHWDVGGPTQGGLYERPSTPESMDFTDVTNIVPATYLQLNVDARQGEGGSPVSVPEPAASLLLGTGLLAFSVLRRRPSKK